MANKKKKYGKGKGTDDPRKAPQDVAPTTTPEEQAAARVALEEELRQKAARDRANETEVKSSGKAKAVEPSPKVVNTKPSDPKLVLSTEEQMQAEVKAEDFQPKDVIGGEASPSVSSQVASEMTPGVDVEAVKKLSATGGSDPLRPKVSEFEEVSEEEARAAEAAGLSAKARRGASTVVNPIKTAPYDPPSLSDVAALPLDKNYRVDVQGPGVPNAAAVAASREDRVAKGLGTPGDELGFVDVMHNGKSYKVNPDVAAAYRLHRDAWEANKAKGKRAGREFAPNEMAGGHEHALVRIARELDHPEITPEAVNAYSVKVAGRRGAIGHTADVYRILTKDRNSRDPVLKPVGLNDLIQHPTETDEYDNPLRMRVKDAAFHTAFSSHLKVDGKSPSGYSVAGSQAAQPMIDEDNNPVFRHTGFHSIDIGEGKLHYYTDPQEYENYTPLKNRLRSEILSPTPAGSVKTASDRLPPMVSGRVTGYVPFSSPLQPIVDPATPDTRGVPNTGPTAPPRVGIQGDQPFYVSRTARRRNMIPGDPGYVSGSQLDGMYDKAQRLQDFGAKREAARASMGFDPTIVNHLNDQAAELTQSIADVHTQVNAGVFDIPHEDVSYNSKGQSNRDEKGNFTPGVGQQMAKAAMPKASTSGPKVLQGVLDLGEGYDYPQDNYKIHPTYEYDAKGGRITGEGSTRDLATARPEDALLDVQTGKGLSRSMEVAPKAMSRAEAGIPDSTVTPEHQRFSNQFSALLKVKPDTVVDEDGAVAGHSKTDSFATNVGEKPKNSLTIQEPTPLPSGKTTRDLRGAREDVRMGTQPLFAPEKVEQTSYKGFEEVKPEPREEVETPKSPYLPSGGVDYTTPEPAVTPVESDPYQTSGATNKRGRPIDYSTGRSRKPDPVPHQDSLFTDAELMPPQNDALVQLPATRRREAFLGTIGKSDSALIEDVKSQDRGYKQITQSAVAAQPYSSPEIGDFVHHSRYGGGKVVGVKDAAHALTGAPDKHVTIDFGGSTGRNDLRPLALSEHSRFLEKVQPVETFDRAYQDPENPNIGVSTQFSGLESQTSNMPKFTPKKSGKGR